MISIQHKNAIPKSIEDDWNVITGKLICSKCNVQITDFGYESNGNSSRWLDNQVHLHICIPKFNYDFNSKLKIKEQLNLAKPDVTIIVEELKQEKPQKSTWTRAQVNKIPKAFQD